MVHTLTDDVHYFVCVKEVIGWILGVKDEKDIKKVNGIDHNFCREMEKDLKLKDPKNIESGALENGVIAYVANVIVGVVFISNVINVVAKTAVTENAIVSEGQQDQVDVPVPNGTKREYILIQLRVCLTHMVSLVKALMLMKIKCNGTNVRKDMKGWGKTLNMANNMVF
ncbi:hypothetical protein L1887_10497 [Cichorium endivia]|nr:hypothetical protein L1887_10497 [Cichorium endivia]